MLTLGCVCDVDGCAAAAVSEGYCRACEFGDQDHEARPELWNQVFALGMDKTQGGELERSVWGTEFEDGETTGV